MNEGALSFAKDIRPMFTDLDVEHMKDFNIDLSDAADVALNSEGIYTTVSEGTMPPRNSKEDRWTPEMCELFKRWREQGCPP